MFVNVYARREILRLIFDFFFLPCSLLVKNAILGTQLGQKKGEKFLFVRFSSP